MSRLYDLRKINPESPDALEHVCSFGTEVIRTLLTVATDHQSSKWDPEILLGLASDLTADLEDKINEIDHAWGDLIRDGKPFPSEMPASGDHEAVAPDPDFPNCLGPEKEDLTRCANCGGCD